MLSPEKKFMPECVGGRRCSGVLGLVSFGLLALLVSGCPKQIPQPEIDAADNAMKTLQKNKDCAPETYQAAKTMYDRAQALLKEERYDEAKTALLAAQKLAAKADEECQKKRAADEAARKKAEADALAAAKAVAPPPAPTEEIGPKDLQTVHFGFNDSDLNDEAREILSQNAEYLQHHANVRIQIEGHCDSRGSTEYNLALGERRAMSVKQYLVKLGTGPDRMEIISYGEERPVDQSTTEEAYAKNRRAEFKPLSP